MALRDMVSGHGGDGSIIGLGELGDLSNVYDSMITKYVI